MIFEKVRTLICSQFDVDPEKITMQTNFIEDLDADSLDVVELAMNMETEFNLPEISEDEVKSIQTVEDLVEYITAALE